MSDNSEYQFLNMQLDANKYVKAMLESDISKLLQLVHEKRNTIKQIEDMDRELKIRMDAVASDNKFFPVST